MDFTEAHRCTGPVPAFSPNGRLLATAVDARLVIRDVESLQILQLYTCLDRIESLAWSADSVHVLCGLYKRGMVQVWSSEDADWTCKIDEGPAGVVYACWTPDGRHVLTVADFNLRLSIWSLADRSVVQFPYPKLASDKGVCFTPDGAYLIMAERRNCKDYCHLISCQQDEWQSFRRFPLDTQDAQQISLDPTGTHLVAMESSLLSHKMVAYTLDGKLVGQHVAYDAALGIKSAAWGPSGRVLALGGFDATARVLNTLTWGCLAELEHSVVVEAPSSAVAFEEVVELEGRVVADNENIAPPSNKDQQQGDKKKVEASVRSRFVVRDLPLALPQHRAPTDAPHPRIGVSLCSFSSSGRYLATMSEHVPKSVFIWEVGRLQLTAVLTMKNGVTDFAWDPRPRIDPSTTAGVSAPSEGGRDEDRLVVCAGCPRVFVWTPGGASCVHVPLESFAARGVSWSPKADMFVLRDSSSFTCAFLEGGGVDEAM